MRKSVLFVFVVFIIFTLAGCLPSKTEPTTHTVIIEDVGTTVYDYFEVSGLGSVHYLEPVSGKYLRAENNTVPVCVLEGEEYVQVGSLVTGIIGLPYEEISFRFELAADYDWSKPFNAVTDVLVGVVRDGVPATTTGKYSVNVSYSAASYVTDVSLRAAASPEEELNTDKAEFDVGSRLLDITDNIGEYGIFVNGNFIKALPAENIPAEVTLYSDHIQTGTLEIQYQTQKTVSSTDTVKFTLTAAESLAAGFEGEYIVEIGKFTDKGGVVTKETTWRAFDIECTIDTGVVILESIVNFSKKLDGVTSLYYCGTDGKWTLLGGTKVPVYSDSGEFVGNISGNGGIVIFHGAGNETMSGAAGKKIYASSGVGHITLKTGEVKDGVFTKVTGTFTLTCINQGTVTKDYGPLRAYSGETADFYYNLGRSDIDVKAIEKKYSFRYRTLEYDAASSQQYWSAWVKMDSTDSESVNRIHSAASAAIGTLSHGTKVEDSKVKFTFAASGTNLQNTGTGRAQAALVYFEGASEKSVVDVFEITCENKGAKPAN